MKIKIISTVLLFFALNTLLAHKYYVSIATMKYNQAEDKIDVSLKVTAHDFEYLLESKFNQRIHIEEVKDSSEIGLYIQEYLHENVSIVSAGKKATLNYVGKEVTLRDELFFYFFFTDVINPKSIQIKNQLLFSHFTQQQNIVHYTFSEQTKSVTLLASSASAEIKMD